MKEFSIKNYFDGTIKTIEIDTTAAINNTIETITENFVNLYLLGYGLRKLNEEIKALDNSTSWFVKFSDSIASNPANLAKIRLNENISRAINSDWLNPKNIIFPSLPNIAAKLLNYNCITIVRTNATPRDCQLFLELLAAEKIKIKESTRELKKSDLNTISQIFHQAPINIKFDNPNIVAFNDLTPRQHIFICYALKKCADIIELNTNTPTALFTFDENFTAYEVEKQMNFKHGYLGGKAFTDDILNLNFTKIAFMVDSVIMPISIVNIGYDTATGKHKFQLSADFLAKKELIEQYKRFYDSYKLTGLTITELFKSKYNTPEIFMALRMINEMKIRQRDGNPFVFADEAKKYNWNIENKEILQQRLRRLFGFLNHQVQFYKENGRELFALDRCKEKAKK